MIRTLRLRSRLYYVFTRPVRNPYRCNTGSIRAVRRTDPRSGFLARRRGVRGGPRRVTPGRGGPPAAGKTETSGLPARATADAIERTRRTGTRTAAHARSARAAPPPAGARAPRRGSRAVPRSALASAIRLIIREYRPTSRDARVTHAVAPAPRRAAVRLCALDDARGVPYRNRTPSHRARGAASLSQTASFDLFT